MKEDRKHIDLSLFKHKTPIQIRFKDVDLMGHVNNANHLSYFELARMSYFRDVIGEKINWNVEGIILANISIDYILPILIDDEVYVYSKIGKLGNKSFGIDYAIVKLENDQIVILAMGNSVQVCYDYKQNKTTAIHENWINKIKEYENF